jgi:hypothetical protein
MFKNISDASIKVIFDAFEYESSENQWGINEQFNKEMYFSNAREDEVQI